LAGQTAGPTSPTSLLGATSGLDRGKRYPWQHHACRLVRARMKTFPSDEHGLFRHEALLYVSEDEFLAETTAFIRDGLAEGEPTAVATAPSKITRLRERLGADADQIMWIDITGIGSNPARITSLWQEFASKHGDRASVRAIGEVVLPGRTSDELLELRRHEELCNLALAA